MEKIIKLGNFNIGENEYVAFYNNVVDGVDYYYLNEEQNDVECWAIRRTSLKKIVGSKKSHEWFKKNYGLILGFVFSKKPDESIVRLQTFERKFWDDAVMKDFTNIELTVIDEEDVEKIKEESNKR